MTTYSNYWWELGFYSPRSLDASQPITILYIYSWVQHTWTWCQDTTSTPPIWHLRHWKNPFFLWAWKLSLLSFIHGHLLFWMPSRTWAFFRHCNSLETRIWMRTTMCMRKLDHDSLTFVMQPTLWKNYSSRYSSSTHPPPITYTTSANSDSAHKGILTFNIFRSLTRYWNVVIGWPTTWSHDPS